MKPLLYFCAYACLALLAACGLKKKAASLATYVNDPGNGMLHKAAAGNNYVTLRYIPMDMQVLTELGTDQRGIPGETLTATRAKYSAYAYFKFVVVNESLDLDYDQQNFLSFGMADRWQLVVNTNDTIPCAFYQRVATGSRHRQEFMVVFDQEQIKGRDFQFLYVDKIFSLPLMAFPFHQQDINGIPQL